MVWFFPFSIAFGKEFRWKGIFLNVNSQCRLWEFICCDFKRELNLPVIYFFRLFKEQNIVFEEIDVSLVERNLFKNYEMPFWFLEITILYFIKYNTVQYTVQYAVQYSIQYSMQYSIQYSIVYTIQYSIQWYKKAHNINIG